MRLKEKIEEIHNASYLLELEIPAEFYDENYDSAKEIMQIIQYNERE